MGALADIYALAKIVLDEQGLVADAGKAGDAAGKAVSSRMGDSMRGAIRGGLGAIAGALLGGAAARGAELDDVMSTLASDTGLVGDEAARAKSAIAGIFGDNIVPMRQVGETMAKVHNDLGLTGDAMAAMTDKFVKYEEATNQGAEAVSAFDDILDKWGLQASDAGSVMDKLIASHQKYGGEIAQNQKTLAQMADALKAANFTIDDGIALLGLFGAKGLDAEQASAAFAKALTKVKSPDELKRLMADIAAQPDAFKRAAMAADLFGARAGAKLANALGGANLDDYRISLEAAAGATDRAAEASLSWGDRFQLAVNKIGGGLAEFGQSFGPLLMVAGQFGPKITSAIASGLGGLAGLLLPKIAAQLGLTLPAWIAGGAAAGAAEGTAQAAAVAAAGPEVAAGVAAQTPAVVGAAEAQGAAAGASLIGGLVSRLAIGAAIAIPVTLVVTTVTSAADSAGSAAQQVDEVTAAIESQSVEKMRKLRDRLQATVDRMPQITRPESWFGGPSEGEISTAAAGIAALDRALQGQAENAALQASGKIRGVLASEAPAIAEAAASSASSAGVAFDEALAGSAKANQGAIVQAARDAVAAAAQAVRDGKAALASAWQDAENAAVAAANAGDQIIVNNAQIAAQRKILADRKATAAEKAQARITLRNLQASNAQLLVEQAGYGTRSEQIAKTKALLTSSALLNGLKSKDPDVRQHWADVRSAAERQLAALQAEAAAYGAGTAQNYADGIESKLAAVRNAAYLISGKVKAILKTGSPADEGPLSGIGPDEYGAHLVESFAAGMASAVAAVGRSSSLVAAAAVPRAALPAFAVPGAAMPSLAASGVAGGAGPGGWNGPLIGSLTVNPPPGATLAQARQFGQAVLDTVAGGLREQRARYAGGTR